MLRKSPGFTAVAVLQPLPFYEPDQLVILWERGPKHGSERDAVNRQLYAY
jgi:hypothetical protein